MISHFLKQRRPIRAIYMGTKNDPLRHATVKGISGDECTLDLIDYGDFAIVKSAHLRAVPAAYADPSVAYRCTLDVSKFTCDSDINQGLLKSKSDF